MLLNAVPIIDDDSNGAVVKGSDGGAAIDEGDLLG